MSDEFLADGGSPEYGRKDLHRIGARWLDRIKAAEKREENWIKDAKEAEAAYLVDDEASETSLPDFNILHSNVETIVPSIYNSTPSPDIRPRHNAQDPIAKAVSDVFERAISTQIDDNVLDCEIEGAAQDAFMAGRGVVRVKFDADEVETEFGVSIQNERVEYEVVAWRDYREGPAKRWKDVPWVAYAEAVSDDERKRLENPEIIAQYEEGEFAEEEKDCTVWQIWCRETLKVYLVVEESGKVLNILDDPLGLKDFFPQPQPIQPITGTGQRCPVCPYAVYKKLAKEVDTATQRINAIMKGLKVRGVIAADASVLDAIAEAGDNEIVSVQNIENLVAAGGLEKAVMWWPIEKAITVIKELYVQREQSKQAIYEVTGISDIIRGQGAASETATAQQIKTEWGALRVKKMQRLIERQVRDIFKISAEIISKHFSFETLQRASGLQVTPEMQQLIADPLNHYRIDVESDSTVRADLTKGRQEMAEFLNGTASFFSAMAPIVGQAPETAGPIAEMYTSFARQFNLGKAAEDALEQFAELAKKAASQPRPDPEAEAKKAEMEMKGKEFQGKMMLEMKKLGLQVENLRLDAKQKQAELGIKGRELDHKDQELKLKEGEALVNAAAKFDSSPEADT